MPPAEKPASPRSYSTAELADRLGVSIPTIQRWVDAGRLSAWKTPGGHRRIEAASAERLLAAGHQVRPERPPPVPVAIVVDDNPDDRELLVAIVQSALPAASVLAFDSAVQALVAIGRRPPDLLITDIAMPHMDGLEMLRQLAALSADGPRLIVVVSADCDAAGRPRRALPAGVFFAPKPIDSARLVKHLRRVMTGRDQRPPRA